MFSIKISIKKTLKTNDLFPSELPLAYFLLQIEQTVISINLMSKIVLQNFESFAHLKRKAYFADFEVQIQGVFFQSTRSINHKILICEKLIILIFDFYIHLSQFHSNAFGFFSFAIVATWL